MNWKRRVISHYKWPTTYGDLLSLNPGPNLVEESAWDAAKQADDRIGQQLAAGRVVDEGFYAEIVRGWITAGRSVTTRDLAPLGVEEAQALVGWFSKDRNALELLARLAERGGVKAVFKTALAGKG